MNSLILLIKAHPTMVTMGGYYVLSAAIGSLPMPDGSSNTFYKWFFAFANAVAANVTRAYASKLPASAQGAGTGGK